MTTTAYTTEDKHEIALSALEDAILNDIEKGGRFSPFFENRPNVHNYVTIPDNKPVFTESELYEAVFNALENARPTY